MITSKQADLLVSLLFKLFPSYWRMVYKALFFRVVHGLPSPIRTLVNDNILSIETHDDLALIALADSHGNSKKCSEAIGAVLSSEQLHQLLKKMLTLKITEKGRRLNSVKTVSELVRDDTLAACIQDKLLDSSKKALVSQLNFKNDCDNFITMIYSDIVKSGQPVPEAIPTDYVMSDNCQKITAKLLMVFSNNILEFIQKDQTIKYVLALIKSYAVNDVSNNEVNDFLLGNLANRVISSTLSRYVAPFSEERRKELKKLEEHKKSPEGTSSDDSELLNKLRIERLRWSIANIFLSRPLTYIVGTDPKEKPIEKANFPAAYHETLLDPRTRSQYSDFCLGLNINNLVPSLSIVDEIKCSVHPELGQDRLRQELRLYLWFALNEICVEFVKLREKAASGVHPETAAKFKPLEVLTLPKFLLENFITELKKQMSLLAGMSFLMTEDGTILSALIKRHEMIEKIYHANFPLIDRTLSGNRHSHDSQSLRSPRNNEDPQDTAEISPTQTPRVG